ncbi:MAG: FHA domain-containing protein [Candidatus Thorarchaeota archaeon]|jgi:pSer/pThr/pTyr-binding forkhead associated (FHA) protein
MAASGKKTTAELLGYYKSGGSKALKDYYKDTPVLVVFPSGKENSVTWTPYSTGKLVISNPSTPESSEVDLDYTKIVPRLPEGSVVVPINCHRRNHWTAKVGRSETLPITLSDSAVSRYHAEFIRGSGWSLVDLNSLNGTYIDGIRLLSGRPYAVQPYREIRFGPDVRTMFMDIRGLIDVCKVL